MRWHWLNFTQTRVPEGPLDEFRSALFRYPRMIRKSGAGSRVPAWTWDLYEVTRAECAASWGPHPERDPRPSMEFRVRLRLAVPVVNKPGGVEPDVFVSALRLGGWEATRALHSSK